MPPLAFASSKGNGFLDDGPVVNLQPEEIQLPSNIASLRAVISQPPRDFGAAIDRVLSPSRPLQSEEFLRGRAEQLNGIERALYASGRHVLIHGLRGVGKSSLA